MARSFAMMTRTPGDAIPPPLILMTADIGGQGSERQYLVRANYAEAVAEAGGVALILPCEVAALPAALAAAGGVMITGARPGAEVSPERVGFERALIRQALAGRTPLLGICHGMQLIGEHLGGTVVKDHPGLDAPVAPHIPDPVPDGLAHEIRIEPGTGLAACHPGPTARVNSLHRHILAEGGRFRVAARAEDGLIEAIESEAGSFCLGVQWHPEYRLTPFDRAVLAAFVQACACRRATREAAPAEA